MWGIDVSHHQGTINWYKVAQFGVQFAIMKAMYERKSHHPDERFNYNYENAGLNGIERGAYIYNLAYNQDQAAKEAEDFIKILDGRILERGIWLDLEDSRLRSLSKPIFTQLIKTEADIFRSAGYKVGIYCNKDWYFNVLDGRALESEYTFWIARYPSTDTGYPKNSLKPSNYGSIWQYSSKGNVDGIATNVDMNCDLDDMSKSYDQLLQEVLEGKWGNDKIRKNRITGSGYDYETLRKKVNAFLASN